MNRARLKNIINKSKELSNKLIGEPYDLFVASLPSELDYYKDGGKYRLKAAWKAYGEPKNYQEALWNGLVETLDGKTFVMPSIGYNEENDSYEYLNKGKENEIVGKDIRAWDNDVIPFIKELKLGGYVRTFDEEKDCWKYSKNSQKTQQVESGEVIEEFKQGGSSKKPYYEWYKSLPENKRNDSDYDLARAYYELPYEELEKFRTDPDAHLNGDYKKPNHPTYSDENYGWKGSDSEGWTFVVSPRQQLLHDFNWYKNYWDHNEPNSKLIFNNESYRAQKPLGAFKQGGQMTTIPAGELHARKNHMEDLGLNITKKGIAVIDQDGQQQAEIERNEIIFCKKATDKIEEAYKKFNDSDSEKEKDEIAIRVGKFLTQEIIENTEDKTNLIEEVANKS